MSTRIQPGDVLRRRDARGRRVRRYVGRWCEVYEAGAPGSKIVEGKPMNSRGPSTLPYRQTIEGQPGYTTGEASEKALRAWGVKVDAAPE